MQKKKAEAIRQAIDDEKMLEALSVQDLMSLFGKVAYDDEHRPYIRVNDKDDEDENAFVLVDDEGEFTKEAPPTMLRRRYVIE